MPEAMKTSPPYHGGSPTAPAGGGPAPTESQQSGAGAGGSGSGSGGAANNGPSPNGHASTSKATDGHVTRKGRACLTCRKLKVKCSGLERGERACHRCQRLGLDCKIIKKLRLSLEDGGYVWMDDGRTAQPAQLPSPEASQLSDPASLTRLDRSVRAILARLEMPPLESFSQPSSADHNHLPVPGAASSLAPPLSTAKSTRDNSRENSREPESKPGQYDIAGAPMEGLYEATHLSALRSRSAAGRPTHRRSRKNIESDLISQGVITVEEAERMLTLFKTSLSRYLYNATISEDRSLQSIRESSTLFFTALMAVSSLHIPGMESIYDVCHRQLRELIASSMFDRSHTLEDIRALCVAAFWLPDLSWKLSGHCVRMATELNLHQAFFKAFHSQVQHQQPPPPPEEREETLERARLWYLLYVLDHHFSIAYGRPPATSEMQAIRETDLFLQAPECTNSDRRVISQVALFRILSKAYNAFGLEAGRLMDGDDETLIVHARFIEDLSKYREHFRPLLRIDEYVGSYSVMGIELHFNFNSMLLNSLALRGRSMAAIANLPHRLRPLAFHAIESAHRILEIVLGEPDFRRSLVGVPLYLHAMIAFAVVFLIKLSSIWESIGVSIDPHARTKPLIDLMITTMKECEAGAHHILYKMATGFERLLRRSENSSRDEQQHLQQNLHHHNSARPAPTSRRQADPTANRDNLAPLPDHTPPQQPQNLGFLPDSQAPPSQAPGGANYAAAASAFDNTYGGGVVGGNHPHDPTGWPTTSSQGGGVDDDLFWSMVGTDYDLLANGPDTHMSFYGFHDMPYPGK